MKRLILLLLLIINFGFNYKNYAQEDTTISYVNSYELGTIIAVNDSVLCTTGGQGIWRTTDRGNTWNQVFNNVFYIQGMTFYQQTGYALAMDHGGSFDRIIKTVNSGLSWENCFTLPVGMELFGELYARNENEVIAKIAGGINFQTGVGSGKLYRTIDGGISWNLVTSLTGYMFSSLSGNDYNKVYVATHKSFCSSSDLLNWQCYPLPGASSTFLNAIQIESQKIYGIGYGTNMHSAIFSSINDGQSWSKQEFPESGNLYYLDIHQGRSLGIMARRPFSSTVYYKGDRSLTWKVIYKSDDSIRLESAVITDKYCFVVGDGGIIIRFNLESLDENIKPEGFQLYQNYPNPFNPITTIRFDLPEKADVRLEIFDITGRIIKKILSETKFAGEYLVQLNAKDFSSGVYFYTLSTGNFIETKKMILLK